MTECLKFMSISTRKGNFRKPIFGHFISVKVKPKQSAVGKPFFRRPKEMNDVRILAHPLSQTEQSPPRGRHLPCQGVSALALYNQSNSRLMCLGSETPSVIQSGSLK